MFADGRLVERTAGGKTSEDRLGADRLAAVRRALAATDWGALPARLLLFVLAMEELELARAAGDRRLYALGDIGTVRLKGWAARAARAEANGRAWEFARRGFWRQELEADRRDRDDGRAVHAARDAAGRSVAVGRSRIRSAPGEPLAGALCARRRRPRACRLRGQGLGATAGHDARRGSDGTGPGAAALRGLRRAWTRRGRRGRGRPAADLQARAPPAGVRKCRMPGTLVFIPAGTRRRHCRR